MKRKEDFKNLIASLGKILNDMSVFNAPYIYRDAAHAVKATQPSTSDVLQELNKQLIEKGGLRVLGSCYRGARQLSANFPVYSPEDESKQDGLFSEDRSQPK